MIDINIVKIISSEFDKKKRAIMKFLRYGKDDVQTSPEATPHGIDSRAVKDMVAIYLSTSEKGSNVVVGYVNKDLKAEPGETRIFSTNKDGKLQAFAWFHADGSIELNGTDVKVVADSISLKGNTHSTVRYSPLNVAQNKLAIDLNVELGKIATGIAAGGGSYVPTPIQIDISGSENSDVKMN